CAAVIGSACVTFVAFVVVVIVTFSLVRVDTVEVLLLLTLDVHPATTTVNVSSAVIKQTTKTRPLSII
ncbi:MAG: hypothetical protein ACXWEP_06080, partial [Halobacteriota archaeon]